MTDEAAPPAITIVVPTRDRPEQLAGCLAAVARQGAPRGDLEIEIVVVDDGSHDSAAVAGVAARNSARLVRQSRLGVAAARNAGTKAARGELVCFIDDDCRPAPAWLTRMVARLEGGADVVGGVTVVEPAGGTLSAASQMLANAFYARVGGDGFAPASNLGCRSEVVSAIPFDERFHTAGEDRDWYARVGAAGKRVEFAPEAVVVHSPDLTTRAFLRKHLWYGRASYRFRHLHRRPLLEPPAFYRALLATGFRDGVGTGLAVCAAQLATAAGFAAEAIRSSRA